MKRKTLKDLDARRGTRRVANRWAAAGRKREAVLLATVHRKLGF